MPIGVGLVNSRGIFIGCEKQMTDVSLEGGGGVR